jgi:hypothetical protein
MSKPTFDLGASAYAEMIKDGFQPDFLPGTDAQVAAIRAAADSRAEAKEPPDANVRDLRDLYWSSRQRYFAAPAHTKGTPYTAPFTFDPTQIALTQNPDGTRTASIELDLGAFDAYGKLAASRSQTFKLNVTPAQYAVFYRKPINLSLAIDLPHGQLNLRAGVFDTAANKAGTLEIPLNVPKNPAPR